jgi:hypothetical protein
VCVCDVILRSVRVNFGGFRCFWKHFNSGAFAWIWENSPLVGNVAPLVECENITLTVSIAHGEIVTEFRNLVRRQ